MDLTGSLRQTLLENHLHFVHSSSYATFAKTNEAFCFLLTWTHNWHHYSTISTTAQLERLCVECSSVLMLPLICCDLYQHVLRSSFLVRPILFVKNPLARDNGVTKNTCNEVYLDVKFTACSMTYAHPYLLVLQQFEAGSALRLQCD